jgi:hypothetical protein
MGCGRDSSEGEVDGHDPGEFDEPDLTCPWSVCQVGKLAAERDDLRRRIGEQAGTHLEKFIQWRRRVRDAETRLASAVGALRVYAAKEHWDNDDDDDQRRCFVWLCHETGPDEYGGSIARAVLSAVPSYAQGWDDAKRRAVENVERVNMFAIGKRSAQQIAVDAIRAIEPEKGTHEERWAAAGWPFKWSDDHRAYIVERDWYIPFDRMGVLALPTVQAVDAWIAARGKDKTP